MVTFAINGQLIAAPAVFSTASHLSTRRKYSTLSSSRELRFNAPSPRLPSLRCCSSSSPNRQTEPSPNNNILKSLAKSLVLGSVSSSASLFLPRFWEEEEEEMVIFLGICFLWQLQWPSRTRSNHEDADKARPCLLPGGIQREMMMMLRDQRKVSARLLQRIKDRVNRWYQDEGYAYAQVTNSKELVCEVIEGDITQLVIHFQDKLGNVIEGNTQTPIVHREISKQATTCMGELGAATNILELGAEIRIPVKNTHVYAFAEHGNDLGRESNGGLQENGTWLCVWFGCETWSGTT